LDKVFENDPVKRHKDIPVNVAAKSTRGKIGADYEAAFFSSRNDPKFQPCLSGHFHFGAQQEALILAQILYAPQINRLSKFYERMTFPAAAAADAQENAVYEASKSPHPVIAKPAIVAADATE
jgi:hypothetical protein